MSPLQQGFSDQSQLRRVGGFERKLEVTNPSVQQLGAAATGASSQVMAFQQGHTQAAPHALVGNAGTAGASADHQEIEARVIHASGGSAKRRHPTVVTKSGADQDPDEA